MTRKPVASSYIDELEGLTFQQLLLKRIDELGITQKELAERVGVDPGSVNRWCNNEKRLIDSSKRPDLIRKLALALRVPMTSICDAFDRSGMLLPLDASNGSTPQPIWIEHDVLPEMEAWIQAIVSNPAFADDIVTHRVSHELYTDWRKKAVDNNHAVLRFPVTERIALQWYEARRLNPYVSMPLFLARAIMTSPSPDPYPFAGKECDAALDRMRDFVNTKMTIVDRMCTNPRTAIGDDHVEEQTLFLELFCHIHTEWTLEYEEDGSHIPLDPYLVGLDKAVIATLNANWHLLFGTPAPETEIRKALHNLPKKYADGLESMPPRCAVAFNR